jgi:GNAT superfamily N-acetyltransferase
MDVKSASIVRGYTVGCLGRIVELESLFFKDQFGLSGDFELKIARALAEFLAHYDPMRDGLWLVLLDGRVEGAIAIDGKNAHREGAQLRWFIVSPLVRGTGLGNTLLSEALAFCREKAYPRLYLWTFARPSAAKHLYEKYGFKCTQQICCTYAGVTENEERFDLLLSALPHPVVQMYRSALHLLAQVQILGQKVSSLSAFFLGVLSTMMMYSVRFLHPLHILHIFKHAWH